MIHKWNTAIWTIDLIASTNKLSLLIKMTKWHAHVVHMAKHMNMVEDPGPGNLGPPPKSGADIAYILITKLEKWPTFNIQ